MKMESVIVLIVFVMFVEYREISGECGINRLYDVVLVIDDSGSVSDDGFNQQVAFCQYLATKLYIADKSVNYAYVLNNDAAEFQFGLREHLTYSDIETAFAGATKRGGSSNVGAGFIYAYDNILSTSMRNGATGYVIQITDAGNVDAAGETAVSNAKAAGITIFTIGVGISGTDVQNMATTTSHYFSISNFDGLTSVADSIVEIFCPYYCELSYYMYTDLSSSFSSVDTDTGKTIQLRDKAYSIECCGTASAIDFYAVAAGEFQFQVWRSNVLAAKIDVTVTASQVNTIVNLTFTSEESMAIISGDYFGWYWKTTNPVGYTTCSDDLCLNTSMIAATGGIAVDSSYDWSGASTVMGKAYALKVYTTNNTEPTFDLGTTEKSIPDHTAVGVSVMEFSFTDTDIAEVFTYSVSDSYFDVNGTNNFISVKSALPHTGQQMVHSVVVIGEDSCQHVVTGTVTITTYNEPPTFTNLPDDVELRDDAEGETTLFTVSVTDLSTGDTVACSLSKTVPKTTYFSIGSLSNGSADIKMVSGAELDFKEVPEYQVFINCTDNIDYIDSILTIKIISAETTTPITLPAWTVAAISVSLTAMFFVLAIICFLLVVILATTDEAEVMPILEKEEGKKDEEDTKEINEDPSPKSYALDHESESESECEKESTV